MASSFSNLATVGGNLGHAQAFIIGAKSGLVTGVAADADLFAVRNIATKRLAITSIRIRWVTTTAFGSSQGLAFQMHKVYGFTAVHTGGTPTAIQAHYKDQADVTGTSTGDRIALTEISTVMAGTAAITTATYTAADADEPEVFAVGAGSTLPGVYEDWQIWDKLPLILPADTGLVLKNVIAMGASGVGRLFVGIEGFRL